MILAKREASARDAWPGLRERIDTVYRGANLASDPSLTFDQEYLLAIGNTALDAGS